MAARSKTACASRSKSTTPCARCSRATSRSACGCRATDWVEGGWDLAQTIEFAKALKARGVDWIDASSGGVSPQQKIPLGPGYQVQFAEAIKRETGIATIAVGLITEAQARRRHRRIRQGRHGRARPRACSTTRAGAGTPPPKSAAKSKPRRNTGARSRRRRRRCSAGPRSGRGDGVNGHLTHP